MTNKGNFQIRIYQVDERSSHSVATANRGKGLRSPLCGRGLHRFGYRKGRLCGARRHGDQGFPAESRLRGRQYRSDREFIGIRREYSLFGKAAGRNGGRGRLGLFILRGPRLHLAGQELPHVSRHSTR